MEWVKVDIRYINILELNWLALKFSLKIISNFKAVRLGWVKVAFI